MNKDEQMNPQEFLNLIRNYPYIRDDGRLELEPFCVYLSACFNFDGILEQSPKPLDIYILLTSTIREMLGDEDAQHYIQHQRIVDWTQDMAIFFPEKTKTCIHISALVQVSHYWIYDIGHTLMQLPEPKDSTKYFEWVKEEWIAVHGFINGYHDKLYEYQKEFDRRCIRDRGYSLFEALHLSKHRGIGFNAAKENLKARHNSYQMALSRVRQAIANAYFLEAITLQECLISNCLFNYLNNTDKKLNNPSFNTLLTEIRKNDQRFDEPTLSLLERIDIWRVARNKAIHGFITSTNDSLNESRQSFQQLAEITAKEGESLCESLVSWYEHECVNFIPHQFESKVCLQ